ncbi:MAG TPA: D-arabinono-1,4-lactone oxidase [Solirubrobacterales bacterium]|jgi:L-gulonolactone oxidase|nr:D-arabinono-1,4-lactone oxidase [Solirubrobacterales bacterium]
MSRGTRAAPGEWVNWTRDQSCRPTRILRPRSRDELGEAIATAAAAGEKVRVAGSGHSFTEAALTQGTMLRLEALSGVLDADRSSGLVRVGGGTVLADLNEQLAGLGLAMENLGDIDRQTIAGAISTGTHGTGARLRNISAQVEGLELVLGDGSVRHLSVATDSELLRAARVGVGALGAITAVTLRCLPAFDLLRVDSPLPREEVLDSFAARADGHEHFELFTFPYSDLAFVLERDRTEEPPRPRARVAAYLNDIVLENWTLEALAATGKVMPRLIPALSRLAGRLASGGRTSDRSDRVFVNERRVRFTEMEYAIPREHGPEAARRVVEWVRSNRYPVFFPIEMRVSAGDDACLSPAHDRDTAYLAVHQYRGMEWRPYFEAVEAIMDDYGGRPHWGKRHFQTVATLAPRYPAWAEFQRARDLLDPGRVFANDYTDRVLGP